MKSYKPQPHVAGGRSKSALGPACGEVMLGASGSSLLQSQLSSSRRAVSRIGVSLRELEATTLRASVPSGRAVDQTSSGAHHQPDIAPARDVQPSAPLTLAAGVNED